MCCNSDIDTTDAGYGYMQTDMTRDYWHSECIQQFEGVEL